MKITLEELTVDELLKIAEVLTDKPVKQTKEIAEVAYIPNSEEFDVLTLDKEGLPWDERIHSSNHKMTSNGIWQRRRGISDVEYNRIKAELQIPIAEKQSVIPETTVTPYAPAASIVPVDSTVSQPAVIPAYDFINNAVAPATPVESPVIPMAAQSPVSIPQAPVTPVTETPESLYNRMFEQLRNGLQMKILDANFMQNVIAGVNATYGTSYQGAAELRDNTQALKYVINELVKKGL